jgi:hypothetical protein
MAMNNDLAQIEAEIARLRQARFLLAASATVALLTVGRSLHKVIVRRFGFSPDFSPRSAVSRGAAGRAGF